MGLITALFFTPVIIIGVTCSSPMILSIIGLKAAGPVAGGIFASMQGASITSGSWMAAAQSIAMITATPTP